jgi:hypothetical protein
MTSSRILFFSILILLAASSANHASHKDYLNHEKIFA